MCRNGNASVTSLSFLPWLQIQRTRLASAEAAAARGALSKAKGQKEGVKEEGTNNPMRVLGCE